MRYTNVFCGSYSLEKGTRAIALFYIVIYLLNIFLNIFVLDIVKKYKETVNEDLQYDETGLVAFHYICLAFGVVTILLSVSMLVKLTNQSEDFWSFIIKWNIFRCFLLFAGILYVCIDMDEILTVSLSSGVLIIDFCVSTYFIGVIASFAKMLGDPNDQGCGNMELSPVHLVSHKKTSSEHQVAAIDVVDRPPVAPSRHSTTIVVEVNSGRVNRGLEPEDRREQTANSDPPSAETLKEIPKEPDASNAEANEEAVSDLSREKESIADAQPSTLTDVEEVNPKRASSQRDHTPVEDESTVASESYNEKTEESDGKRNSEDLGNNVDEGNLVHSEPNPSSVTSEDDESTKTDQLGEGEIVVKLKVDSEAEKEADKKSEKEQAGLDESKIEPPAIDIVSERTENKTSVEDKETE